MKNAVARSDRALILALSIVLATASAAVGSAMTYHPFQARPAVTAHLTTPVAPQQPLSTTQRLPRSGGPSTGTARLETATGPAR